MVSWWFLVAGITFNAVVKVRARQPRDDIRQGLTAEEPDAKLVGTLRELKLIPEQSTKDER